MEELIPASASPFPRFPHKPRKPQIPQPLQVRENPQMHHYFPQMRKPRKLMEMRELLQFHNIAAIPDIPAPDEDTNILTLDITVIDPIDTASYDTSTSPLFRSAMMR